MRIKVTGYVQTTDWEESDLDLESETGLSDEAYDEFVSRSTLEELTDLEVVLEK